MSAGTILIRRAPLESEEIEAFDSDDDSGPAPGKRRWFAMVEISESNYPVTTPIGARLTRELVDDVAKVLEGRGFPPLSAQDHGRLHLVLYDFLYEGYGESQGAAGGAA